MTNPDTKTVAQAQIGGTGCEWADVSISSSNTHSGISNPGGATAVDTGFAGEISKAAAVSVTQPTLITTA